MKKYVFAQSSTGMTRWFAANELIPDTYRVLGSSRGTTPLLAAANWQREKYPEASIISIWVHGHTVEISRG